MPICTMRLVSSRPSSMARRNGVPWVSGCRRNTIVWCRNGRRNGSFRPDGSFATARATAAWSDDRHPPRADCAGRHDRGDPVLDALKSIHQIDGIDRDVADIGDIGEVEGRDLGNVVDARIRLDWLRIFARSMARACPIGRAAVPGDADQRDVEPFGGGTPAGA